MGQTASDRYDIETTADVKIPGNQLVGPMLQKLLEERFQLKVRRETRQLPVYVLTLTGPVKMQTTKPDSCAAPCGVSRTGARGLARTLDGGGVTMASLAESLSRTELNRTVIDQTGLIGKYDLSLRWAIDPSLPSLDDNRGGARTVEPPKDPTIFIALQEQLGLKLDSTRGPVEVVVIDRAEKPTEN